VADDVVTAMRLAICLLAVILASSGTASAFEGVVTSRRITVTPEAVARLSGGGDPAKLLLLPIDKLGIDKGEAGVSSVTSTISIRGSQVRADSSADAFVLMNADTGVLQVVNTTKHTVMEWNKVASSNGTDRLATLPQNIQDQLAKLPPERRAALDAAVNKPATGAGAAAAIPLRDTGKVQTIAAMKCRGYESKTADETVLGWVSTGAGDASLAAAFRSFAAAEQTIRPGPKNARMLLAEKGLPVRVQTLSPRGYQIDEIVRVEEKAVPEESFKIPPGYLRTDASGMLGGRPSQTNR